MDQQSPLPPRPGEHPPPSPEQLMPGGQPPNDEPLQPLQPRPAPQTDAPKTM